MAIGSPNTTFSQQNNQYARILYSETFDDKGYTNDTSLTQARMVNPDTLNPIITFMMGSEQKKFPLLFLTEGQAGGVNWKEIEDVEYDWPVMGRTRLTSQVAGHDMPSDSEPGRGGTMIEVVFKDAWLKLHHTIISPNGYKARILYKPTKVSTGYKYILDVIAASRDAFIPLSEFTANTTWAMHGGANVANSYSFGNESNKQFPGKLKNQIGIIRKSYEFGGNISSRTVIFELPTAGGGKTKLWLPFEEYQHELNFKQSVEENLWDSTYNRDASGVIRNIDPDTQLPIPMGAGLLQQIPNIDTYSTLTVNKLNKVVREVMFGATDTEAMNIVLYTGTGGKEEFSNAILAKASGWNLYDGALNNTITGGPRGLVFGAYFTQYRHVDGHTITVADLPMLDHGGRAQNAPKHPVTGLPITSYEMHFIDMSTYEGQKNVQLVSQKGRALIRGLEQGMALYKGNGYGDYNGNALSLATSQDKTSIHFLKTCGVAIRRNTHCFSLYCDLTA